MIEDYIKAGKIVSQAKKLGREIAKPGIPLIEICNRCEEEIIKNGADLAFPVNISLNEIAAHYSSPIDDKTVIPEEGLLKLDMGAHVNGYIADSAFTINLSQEKKYELFITAAEESLEAAIEKFRPGVKLFEVGEVIAEKIIKYGLKPIMNLGGHRLLQYNLHAGEFVPNFKDKTHNQEINVGDAYAIEPFTTNGIGRVNNGKNSYIYRFYKSIKKNIPYELKASISQIKQHFSTLPFSPRDVLRKKLFPKKQIMPIINQLRSKGVLQHYPILIEAGNGFVAQAEHTVVVTENKTIITTL
jgi:methionyl aminopeptidase